MIATEFTLWCLSVHFLLATTYRQSCYGCCCCHAHLQGLENDTVNSIDSELFLHGIHDLQEIQKGYRECDDKDKVIVVEEAIASKQPVERKWRSQAKAVICPVQLAKVETLSDSEVCCMLDKFSICWLVQTKMFALQKRGSLVILGFTNQQNCFYLRISVASVLYHSTTLRCTSKHTAATPRIFYY